MNRPGRIIFTGGPIYNPSLDILALRTVGDVTAGITVSGTLNNYDSIQISQHSLGGMAISGTTNLISGRTNLFLNGGYSLRVNEGGTLNTSYGAGCTLFNFGTEDVLLINEGEFHNSGEFLGGYFIASPAVSAIQNSGAFSNMGKITLNSGTFGNSVISNHGQLTNDGILEISSTSGPSGISIINHGILTNTAQGLMEIDGFTSLRSASGSTTINRGWIELTDFQD